MYVNYGTDRDFEELRRLNVSLKGKIAIARYGKNFRGDKVRFYLPHCKTESIFYSYFDIYVCPKSLNCSVVRFLSINPMVSGSNPTSIKPSLRVKKVARSMLFQA